MGAVSGALLSYSLLPLASWAQTEQCDAESGCRSTWRSFKGCAIPAGDDLAEPKWLTVEEAKDRCSAESDCAGFTFEGLEPEGPANGPVWVHFKTAFDCVDADWIAWRKVTFSRGGPKTPVPALAVPQKVEEDGLGPEFSVQHGVALCLLGQVRMLSHTHQALEQHLLQTLQPEVFLYGPKASETTELFSLKGYVVDQQWEEEALQEALYAETTQPERTIDVEYMQVPGNWFGNQCVDPPLRDNRPGSAVCSYYSQNKCLQMIQSREQLRGARYQHVIVSRFDFRWLAPHPPLNLLNEAMWIPSGSDWEGGINDRHVAMPRNYAEIYLGAWKLLTSGDAVQVMLKTLGPQRVNGYPGPNTENFLLARLRYFNVTIQRFPSVAYLVCTLRSRSRWTQCFGTTSQDAAGWLYKEEMEHATRIAKCIRFSWTLEKMDVCKEDISHLYRGFR